MNMENNLIKEFTDKIINNDDTSNDTMRQIIINKTKELVNSWKKKAVFEGIFDDGAIKLNGDDVVINGKVVGHLKYDLEDEAGGLNFVSEDKRFSKEFDSLEDFYSYLMKTFGVKENSEKSLGTKIEDPKKIDFEGKENLAKQPGTEGADPDGKKEADKKSETKGEFKPEETKSEGPLNKYSKLKGLIADIKAGKRKTSTDATGVDSADAAPKGELDHSNGTKGPDSVDVVSGHDASGGKKVFENKKNWNMDNSEAAGEGKESALKAKIKRIKGLADSQGTKKENE